MAYKRRANGQGTLFKRTPRGPWRVAWFDHNGKRREKSTRTTDRAAAERIVAKLVADTALRIGGVVDPREDDFVQAERRAILLHLDDFIADVAARGTTADHCKQTKSLAQFIIQQARIDRVSELTAVRVRQVVRGMKEGGKSLARCNHALRAIKSFSRWLHRNRRLREDPLITLGMFNASTDRRRVRRTLTDPEITCLIAAAQTGLRVAGMSGPDRAMLYHVALGTGFRASELASLTPPCFDLDGDPPTITVIAAHSKHRRDDIQPIRLDLADRLRPWLQGRLADQPIFRINDRGAIMLRADLRRARIHWLRQIPPGPQRLEHRRSDFLAYTDQAGRVADFHCLRHTFITRIVAGGASVKTAQTLARHSTPTLTIGRYAHAQLFDLTRALDALPQLDVQPSAQPAIQHATGTDGAISASASNCRANACQPAHPGASSPPAWPTAPTCGKLLPRTDQRDAAPLGAPSRIDQPVWRNWQTRRIQNPLGP